MSHELTEYRQLRNLRVDYSSYERVMKLAVPRHLEELICYENVHPAYPSEVVTGVSPQLKYVELLDKSSNVKAAMQCPAS